MADIPGSSTRSRPQSRRLRKDHPRTEHHKLKLVMRR